MKLLLPFIGGAFSATLPLGTAPMQPINSNFISPNFRPIQNFINPRPVKIVEEIVQQPILRPQSPNMFGGMDPMMMMMLMSDDDSSMKDLLPLMMMQGGAGGMFGGGGQNGMNPLLMMSLLDDDEVCEVNTAVKGFTELTSDQQKSIARGEYIYIFDAPGDVNSISELTAWAEGVEFSEDQQETMMKYIDYEFISCEEKIDSSSFSDLLPLMMMGQNNMQTMDPMMLMMLIDDDSNDLSLPMLMSMQGLGGSGTQANPLLWLSLLDDSTLTKTQCDSKYALPYIFQGTETGTGTSTFSKVTTDIRDVVAGFKDSDNKFIADYYKCIDEATKEGGNTFDDLLPLMMMNGGFGGQGNGQIDPMMMMLMSDSDSDSNLLPLLMMQQGGMNGGQMDPMMMMLLLKD
jgi:hypothetical protein